MNAASVPLPCEAEAVGGAAERRSLLEAAYAQRAGPAREELQTRLTVERP